MRIITVADAFERLYRPQRLLGRSPKTLHQHVNAHNLFRRYLGRGALLQDLTDETLASFAEWLLVSLPRSPVTVNKTIGRVCALWRFLHAKGHLRSAPDQPHLVEPEHVPEAWTREQLAALFAAIAAEPGYIAGVRASDWWDSLHRVLWDTGERIGAVVQLEWRDVDLGRRLLTVRAETRKGGRVPRVYGIAADTAQALERVRVAREVVWYWPHTPSYLWTRYGHLLRRAGLPSDRRSKFHRMRRSTASHLAAAGVDARAALGHSSQAVTRRYLDPRIAGQPSPVSALFRPDSRPE